MPFFALASQAPILRFVPRTIGVLGGDMTGGSGGLAAGRDGVYANYWYDGAIRTGNVGNARIGVIWPTPYMVGRFGLWSPTNGWAAASQYGVARIQLQGSNDTTNIIDGSWTTLYSVDRASNATDSLDVSAGIDITAAYRAHRFLLTQIAYDGVSSGQLNLGIAEMEFYIYTTI